MTIATFIFDPLCGWCYGAFPVLERMGQDGYGIDLLPIGDAEQALPIDAEFADLIWGTDRLVAHHTGQPFTRAYRALLNGRAARLDAWPATLALIAVARTRPDRQIAAVQALQIARFVNGRDTGDGAVVETVLREIGLRNAADLLASRNPVLLAATRAAVRRGQEMLARHGADGGPAVMLAGPDGERLLSAKVLIARSEAQRPRPVPASNGLAIRRPLHLPGDFALA